MELLEEEKLSLELEELLEAEPVSELLLERDDLELELDELPELEELLELLDWSEASASVTSVGWEVNLQTTSPSGSWAVNW